MKRILLCLLATGAFFAFGMVTSKLMAQGGQPVAQSGATAQQPVSTPPIALAVVDYEYLVAVHPKRYAFSLDIQKRIKAEEEKAMTVRQNMVDIQKKLQLLPPGDRDYTKLTADLRRMDSELKIAQEGVANQIQMEQIYALYGAYVDIKACVERYARTYNILVVINSPDITRRLPQDPSQNLTAALLQAEFSPTAVWTHPNLDITLGVENLLVEMHTAAGYKKVNFEDIKKQMYPTSPGAGAATGTNVATGPANPQQGQQPRPY